MEIIYPIIKIIFFFIFIFCGFKIKNQDSNIILDNNSQNIIKKYKNNNNSIVQDSSYICNNTQNLNLNNNIKLNDTKKKLEIYINPYYESEMKYYNKFLEYKDMPKDWNDPLISKEREDILNKFIGNTGRNEGIKYVHFDVNFKFGNQLIVINKLIFYSEIIGIKKIYVNEDNNLYLKRNVYDKKFNLTIEIVNPDKNHDVGKYSLLFYCWDFFYVFFNLKVENRLEVIKDEIMRNLPKVKVRKNDLYIHFRGDDIFKEELRPDFAPAYAQFPLCFYEKIINNNNFTNIYLICQDKSNPVIEKLEKKYKNVITYANNSIDIDIAYLSHAYNIIGSVSSFLTEIIKLNDNLKNFWEYDIYQMEHKFYHLHHSLFNFSRKYTIYRMEPSEKYKKEMYIWTRSEAQLNIMLNDTCPDKFKIIPPNI